MFDKFGLDLEEIYKCKFKIVERDGFIEIICNDKDIEDNEDATEVILKVASKYLNEEQLYDVAITYDYLNEIPTVNIQADKIIETTKILNEDDVKLNKISYSYKINNVESPIQSDCKRVGGFEKSEHIIEKVIKLILGEEKQSSYDEKQSTYDLDFECVL